jgi:hypothetical protein
MTNKFNSRNSMTVTDCTDLDALRGKAGFFGRLGAALAVSHEARKEIADVDVARVREQGAIARTALAAAGVQIKSALLANEVPKIGALLVTLNGRVDAVRQSFTNSAQAGFASHSRNRTNNVAISNELLQQGVLAAEEAAAMQKLANDAAADDIEASLEAMSDNKQVLDHLRDLALRPLRGAKID